MPPSECKECTVKIVQIDEIVNCFGGCGNVFCLKCSNIKRSELKYMSENENIKWFCNECAVSNTNTKFVEIKHLIEKKQVKQITSQDIRENVEVIFNKKFNQLKDNMLTELFNLIENNIEQKLNKLKTEILSELSKSLKDNNQKVQEIYAQNVNNNNKDQQKQSYADAAKKNNNNKLVIKPKNKTKNNKEAKKDLMRVVDPTECLVSEVRELTGGGLLVRCTDTEARERVQKQFEKTIGEEYEMEKSKEKSDLKRMFKIVGMSENICNDRLIECMQKQNNVCKDKNFNIVKIYVNQNKREESYNAIIETDGATYENILKQKRLNVEWDSCIVYEFVNIVRCYRCLGYNHKSNDCINRIACSKCAGNHISKDCNSTILKCVNCCELVQKKLLKTDVHHHAFSVECPAYKKHYENKFKTRK